MGNVLASKAQSPKPQQLDTINAKVRDVISLLDTKLFAALTNIIVAFLDTSSTAKIVLSDLVGTDSVDDYDIRQFGDTIECYTLVDDGKYFHTCKIIWSKSRLDLIWLRDYYNPSTMLMMMNRTDAFHSRHALLKQNALLKQQSHNDDEFMVHTIEETIDVKRHYIVHETSDFGWLLHCIDPIRFKQTSVKHCSSVFFPYSNKQKKQKQKQTMGGCLVSKMNVQQQLDQIICFLDMALCSDLTNLVVQYLGCGSTEFVFSDFLLQRYPSIRFAEEYACLGRHNKLFFLGVVDDGQCFQKCVVTWFRDDRIQIQFPHARISLVTSAKRKNDFQEYCESLRDQTSALPTAQRDQRHTICNRNEIGWELHKHKPLRFQDPEFIDPWEDPL